ARALADRLAGKSALQADRRGRRGGGHGVSAPPPATGGGPAPAGYSGTPLVRKLGIKADARLGLIGAPDGFDATLGELPPGVNVRRRLGGRPFDVIVAFFDRRDAFERRLPALAGALDPAGGLWIAWPKRASGVPTDVTENVVRDLGLAAGLVDNKVC